MRSEFSTCIVCGGQCPYCSSTTGWRKVACSIEHYELFLVLREYQAGRMGAQEAFAKIAKLRADDVSALLPPVQKVLDTISTEVSDAEKEAGTGKVAQGVATPRFRARASIQRRTKEAHG